MTVLEQAGLFWWHGEAIPNGHFAPDASVTGRLKIERDGHVKLELHGMLPREGGDTASQFRTALDRSPLPSRHIQGLLKGTDQYVLLIDVHQGGTHFKSKNLSYENFVTVYSILGSRQFSATDDLMVSEFEIDLSGYDEWLRFGAINFKRAGENLSINYQNPPSIKYPTDDGALSLDYSINAPAFSQNDITTLSLEQKAYIKFLFNRPMTLDIVKTQYQMFCDLLLLFTESMFRLEWPLVTVSSGHKGKFYYARPDENVPDRGPERNKCWTTFPEISDRFGDIWNAWKKKREIFGAGYYLYLGTRRGNRLYAEHRFVSLMWGIESLHRKKHGDVQPTGKLNLKINRILEKISCVADRKWLKQRLRHAGEPSLNERILNVFAGLPINLEAKKLASFSTTCANLRNEISHFGGPKDDKPYDEFLGQLECYSDALSTLYHVLILHEIGVTEEALNFCIYQGVLSSSIKSKLAKVKLLDGAP